MFHLPLVVSFALFALPLPSIEPVTFSRALSPTGEPSDFDVIGDLSPPLAAYSRSIVNVSTSPGANAIKVPARSKDVSDSRAVGDPRGEVRYLDANSPVASDNNPCTESQPCLTVQKAFSTAKAGETWYVKRGMYNGGGGRISLANSGTPNAWITISAYPGDEHDAVIEGGTIDIIQKSYIKLDGLRVQNTTGQGVDILGRGASHIIVTGLHVFNAQQSCVRARGVPERTENGAAYGYKALTDLIIENNVCENTVDGGTNENITVASSVDSFTVTGNRIFHSRLVNSSRGGEGIDVKFAVSNGKIYGNEIHNIGRIAIYLDGSFSDKSPFAPAPTYNIEIFGNKVHDTGQGIIVRTEGRADVRNVKVYNNLIWNISGAKAPVGIGVTPGGFWSKVEGRVTNIALFNNTIYNVAGRGIVVNNELADGVTVRNNITWRTNKNLFTEAANLIIDHNLFGVDPLFVNPAEGDFRLKSGSPAINTGVATEASKTDFRKVRRPNGNATDIGAYEFVAE